MGHILLLGAGFRRNWGAWLASEAFEYLVGCPQVDADIEARTCVRKRRYSRFSGLPTLFQEEVPTVRGSGRRRSAAAATTEPLETSSQATNLDRVRAALLLQACWLLPLTCLAPDLVEAIPDGRRPKRLRLASLLHDISLAWGIRGDYGASNCRQKVARSPIASLYLASTLGRRFIGFAIAPDS